MDNIYAKNLKFAPLSIYYLTAKFVGFLFFSSLSLTLYNDNNNYNSNNHTTHISPSYIYTHITYGLFTNMTSTVTFEHIYKYVPTCWFILALAGLIPDPSSLVPPFVPSNPACSILIWIPSEGTYFSTR